MNTQTVFRPDEDIAEIVISLPEGVMPTIETRHGRLIITLAFPAERHPALPYTAPGAVITEYLDHLQPETDYLFEDIRVALETHGVHFRTTQAMTKALRNYCEQKHYRLKSNMQDGRYMSNGKRYVCLLREE